MSGPHPRRSTTCSCATRCCSCASTRARTTRSFASTSRCGTSLRARWFPVGAARTGTSRVGCAGWSTSCAAGTDLRRHIFSSSAEVAVLGVAHSGPDADEVPRRDDQPADHAQHAEHDGGHPHDAAAAGQRPRPLGTPRRIQQGPRGDPERDAHEDRGEQRHRVVAGPVRGEDHRPPKVLSGAVSPRLSTRSRSVAGRVVLITGAASGMGRAEAHLFSDEGAFVAVTDVTLDGAADVAREIQEAGGKAAAWSLDVRDDSRVSNVVENVVANHGPIDILVNNAGVSIPAPIDGQNYESAWETTLDVNLRGHTRLIRACLPHLMRNGEGRIVNMASTEGVGATAGISPY